MIVRDPELVSRLLNLLGHDERRRIMVSLMETAKPVSLVSEELGIPLRTCYDHVQKMKEMGVLVVERSIVTDNGKRYDVYRCAFRGLKVICGHSGIEVHIIPHEDVVDRFYRYIRAIREAK